MLNGWSKYTDAEVARIVNAQPAVDTTVHSGFLIFLAIVAVVAVAAVALAAYSDHKEKDTDGHNHPA